MHIHKHSIATDPATVYYTHIIRTNPHTHTLAATYTQECIYCSIRDVMMVDSTTLTRHAHIRIH